MGVELPGETIAGDQHNPEGYFEWDAVVALQERLLIDLQRWWPAQGLGLAGGVVAASRHPPDLQPAPRIGDGCSGSSAALVGD